MKSMKINAGLVKTCHDLTNEFEYSEIFLNIVLLGTEQSPDLQNVWSIEIMPGNVLFT